MTFCLKQSPESHPECLPFWTQTGESSSYLNRRKPCPQWTQTEWSKNVKYPGFLTISYNVKERLVDEWTDELFVVIQFSWMPCSPHPGLRRALAISPTPTSLKTREEKHGFQGLVQCQKLLSSVPSAMRKTCILGWALLFYIVKVCVMGKSARETVVVKASWLALKRVIDT